MHNITELVLDMTYSLAENDGSSNMIKTHIFCVLTLITRIN